MGEMLCKVWLGVVLAAFTTVILGLEMGFNVYAVMLKETFNLTQTQVELVSASGILGTGGSLVDPFIAGRFGYRAGYLVALVTNTGAALLMWGCVVYRDVIKDWPGVICLTQFFLCLGQTAGTLRLTSISVQNLPERYVGFTVALILACMPAGKIFYGGLLQMFFRSSLGHFFLCVACICGVSIGLCAVFHTPQNTKPDGESGPLLDTNQPKQLLNQHPVAMMMTTAYFHVLFWPAVMIYSITVSYMNNITSIAVSFGLSEPLYTVYVLSIIVICGRNIFGIFFSKFQTAQCGFILMLIRAFSLLTGLVILVFCPNINSLYVSTVMVGVSMSVAVTIPSSLLALHFGRHNFSYLAGFFLTFASFFSLLCVLTLGIFYDQSITPDGFCYGKACFYRSTCVFLTMTFVSTCVLVINFVRNVTKR